MEDLLGTNDIGTLLITKSFGRFHLGQAYVNNYKQEQTKTSDDDISRYILSCEARHLQQNEARHLQQNKIS